jgi:hypothetical protein
VRYVCVNFAHLATCHQISGRVLSSVRAIIFPAYFSPPILHSSSYHKEIL